MFTLFQQTEKGGAAVTVGFYRSRAQRKHTASSPAADGNKSCPVCRGTLRDTETDRGGTHACLSPLLATAETLSDPSLALGPLSLTPLPWPQIPFIYLSFS